MSIFLRSSTLLPYYSEPHRLSLIVLCSVPYIPVLSSMQAVVTETHKEHFQRDGAICSRSLPPTGFCRFVALYLPLNIFRPQVFYDNSSHSVSKQSLFSNRSFFHFKQIAVSQRWLNPWSSTIYFYGCGIPKYWWNMWNLFIIIIILLPVCIRIVVGPLSSAFL